LPVPVISGRGAELVLTPGRWSAQFDGVLTAKSSAAGGTVIDTCNYGPERDGHIPELDSKSLTSSELLLLLLRHIPDAMVVKAWWTRDRWPTAGGRRRARIRAALATATR
jgi:hypothetical protein